MRPSCGTHYGRKLAVSNLPCPRGRTCVQLHLAHHGCAELVLYQGYHYKSAAIAAFHSRPRPLFHQYRCATVKRLRARMNPSSKLSSSKLTRRALLIFDFYFGRLLTESKRIPATYRRDPEACEDEVRPCQPHATPGPSSCPDGGGESRSNAAPLRAGTLRALCHASYTSRVFFFM